MFGSCLQVDVQESIEDQWAEDPIVGQTDVVCNKYYLPWHLRYYAGIKEQDSL